MCITNLAHRRQHRPQRREEDAGDHDDVLVLPHHVPSSDDITESLRIM